MPPPLIFLGFLLAGLWYDSLWFDGRLAGLGATIVGSVITFLGITVMGVASRRHKQVGTNLEPWKPTTAIIATGIYARSRNPIYLGMALTHGGLAVAGGSTAALVTLGLCVLVIQFYVIAREEHYLEAKFGADYVEYKNKVRRWI